MFVFKFHAIAHIDTFNESEFFNIKYVSVVYKELEALFGILLTIKADYEKRDAEQLAALISEIDTLLGE